MKVRAYAKINLGLHILGKRPDGYHNIETVFRLINLYDELEFVQSDQGIQFSSNTHELVSNNTNLCIRAANLLRELTGCHTGVEMTLSKRIPIGAGLGGGSTDAAAVLKSLTRLWSLEISPDELQTISGTLGSDVPFFFTGQTAHATGRGELLERMEMPLPYTILVVTPKIHVSTSWAYSAIKHDPNQKRPDLKLFLRGEYRKRLGFAQRSCERLRGVRIPGIPGNKTNQRGLAHRGGRCRSHERQRLIGVRSFLRIFKSHGARSEFLDPVFHIRHRAPLQTRDQLIPAHSVSLRLLFRQNRQALSPLRFILAFTCILSLASAQDMPVLDTLARRTADSIRAESYRKRFIPSIGNLESAVDTTSPFHSHEFIHSDAKYTGDLLWKVPGVFLRELGQPGEPAQLNVFGVDNRGISMQLDGRPLNDPVFGDYDLYDIPIEYINEIEIFQGSGSLYEGADSPGGTINFVSHQYNNLRPLTKLRFLQGPYNQILSDGIFAQNITRAVNAMFGFQRQVTDGRFTNSAYDSWNFRLRLRYNLSESINVWGSDFYTKSTLGLNGGIDPTQSPSLYDEVTAVVRDENTYQIRSRHDLTAGIVGKFLADSSSLSKLILYYSTLDREYTNGGGSGLPPVFSDLQGSSLWGMKFNQRIDFEAGTLDVGSSFERRHVDQSHYLSDRIENYTAANAKATFQPVEWIGGTLSNKTREVARR